MSVSKFLVAAAAALVLSACSSGVKLNDTPVETRTGVSPSTAGAGSGGGNASADGMGAKSDVRTVITTPEAQGVGPAGAAKVIYFDYDSYAVKPDYAAVIDAHARYLKADAKRRAVLEGHTDERGGREYNLALGQKRAEAVRRALALQGVSDAQIEAVSFGKEKPAAMGADEASYSKNRRAEITYR